ncbi:MAG: serine hydrolase [Flavobacteriaceae bacterium]|nr:serine hydrolase [Bacteroidia bacterium]NNF75237.1 serine hydrolase [Flavobacteriaceae bacterium]NNK74200.1 serine hydrolase [Flavobacteriaceae bacterium]
MKSLQLIIFLLFITHLSYSQNLETQVDDYLTTIYKSEQPGATVLISKKGEPLYRKSFGIADLELGVTMKPDHVFELGSITKQFTAVSILMLEEQGKLSLQDEITKYIPDYPTHGHKITIHHLLNHTSGIKSYTGMESFRTKARIDMTPTEIIDYFKNEPMDFDPGERFLYNNSGYIILGHIIEVISGESYADFVEKNIFDKLAMKNSYYGSMKTIIPNRATGYSNRDGYVNADYLSLTLPYAAGSLMSNIDDLLIWQNAIKDNKLISQASKEKATNGSELNDGTHIPYGYGWGENNINGSPTYQHGGGIFGFSTMAVYLPEEDVYVAVLTNCDCESPTGVATKIAAMAIGKPFPDKKDAITLSEDKLKRWTGAYAFKDGTIRFITFEDGSLKSQREGSTKFPLYAMSDDQFIFEEGTISYRFGMKKDGTKMVSMVNSGEEIIGVETDRKAPVPKVEVQLDEETLNAYIGKYELNPNFLITVRVQDGKIFAQATGQAEFQMFAEAEHKFFLKAVPAEMIFQKGADGLVTSMTLHQGGQEIPAKKIE